MAVGRGGVGKQKSAADWRAFLRELGRSGNVRLAVCAAGMDVGTAYNRRFKDARFAARWAVELAKGKARAAKDEARLAGARAGGSGELVRRKTRHGDQLVRVGTRQARFDADLLVQATGPVGAGAVG